MLSINPKISDLWRFDGRLSRAIYVFWGSVLFLIKFALDSFVARNIFHQHWTIWRYFTPSQSKELFHLSLHDRIFFLALIVIALPFIWSGMVLTIRRLRDSGMPLALAALFFVPSINLVLFFVLSILHSKTIKDSSLGEAQTTTSQNGGISSKKTIQEDALYTLAITVPMSLVIVWYGTVLLHAYGWGLL